MLFLISSGVFVDELQRLLVHLGLVGGLFADVQAIDP